MTTEPNTASDTAPTKKPRKPRAAPSPKALTTAPANSGDTLGGLPSMNIKHSADLTNRLHVLVADVSNTRLRVKAEMDGQQQRYDEARAGIVAAHERQINEMDEAHDKSHTEFITHLADIDRSLDILKGGLKVADATSNASA